MIAATLDRDPQTLAAHDAVLHHLLDERLPPEFGGGLTTHLPMALHALHALGASEAQMRGFRARYVLRYESRAALEAAPAEDWLALRGSGGEDTHAALAARFAADLAREGRTAVLRRVLPDLLTGVAAGAFHGVIRVAHAVQAGHDGELAEGLAYWAWRWQPLPRAKAPPVLLDVQAWSRQLIEAAEGALFVAPLISQRIELASQSPAYQHLAAALAPQPRLLPQLAGLALTLYLQTRNLTALHMITSLRALRVLQPFIVTGASVQPLLVAAFTAAFLASQRRMPPRTVPRLDWVQAMAAACEADDDHAIKLVHACLEEFAAYGDRRYLDAACLALASN
ncbi:questin oxidase family protein [Pelomonas sp. KK5]|uniref:questin oxidase family protein n=1 Tax=Pelomonas sp. KK5 TaxID=1855730 RepID=UPI00097C6EC0|nr:questin oxidase family protein [Pelomonas sp. KK5]